MPYAFKEVSAQLGESVKEENEAIDLYKKRADFARKAGFVTVARLYDHIRKEEERHSQELNEAKHKLKFKPEEEPDDKR